MIPPKPRYDEESLIRFMVVECQLDRGSVKIQKMKDFIDNAIRSEARKALKRVRMPHGRLNEIVGPDHCCPHVAKLIDEIIKEYE